MTRQQQVNSNSDNGTDQVAAYQVARLGERAVGCTKYKHCRCAERADQKNIILNGKAGRLYKTDKSDTRESADEGPQMIDGLNNCLPVDYVPGNSVGALYFLLQEFISSGY